MQIGKQAPFISQQSVRLALDMLIYSTSRRQTPLLSLLLVDEFVANPDLPNSSHSREFALYQILTSTITSEFAQQRSVFDYSLPALTDTKVATIQMIQKDAETNSPELIGWSWLYHHYVRVDLNIDYEEFCNLVHIDVRTLRRYQHHTIKRLTNLLIKMEWDVRIQRRKRRLLSELPSAGVFTPLIGREEVSAFVKRMFVDAKPPHFQIVGARGVGKTAFVESVLYEQISLDKIDQLIWVQSPTSVEYISHFLSERLLPPEGRITLREYLLTHRTVIVLDDVDLFCNEPATLRILLQNLSPAVVFMTCLHYISVPNIVQITLPELFEQEAQLFTRNLLKKINKNSAPIKAVDHYLRSIWEPVGGNPLAIQLMIGSMAYLDFNSFKTDVGLNAIYSQIFQTLDRSAQGLWIALTLSPPGEIQFDVLHRLWSAHLKQADIGVLLQYHLIEDSSLYQHSRYRLINSARRYIEDMYGIDLRINEMTHYLIQDIDSFKKLNSSTDDILPVMEHILQAPWLQLDINIRKEWITNWWTEGVRRQHWSTWRLLLESYIHHRPPDLNLSLGYAVCLRRLGVWELAEQTLKALLAETGRQGKFLQQAEALLELSIVLRNRGEYEGAVELLAHADQIARLQKSENLISAIALEQVQVAIDLRDPVAAANFMVGLPDTTRTQVFRSEICLLQSDYEQSRSFAHAASENMGGDFSSHARIYTLIGRTYEQQGNLEHAEEYLSWAVMVLEQHEDVFALARAQTNLAGLFMRSGHYEDAVLLLNTAEKLQSQLQDRVALAATRHNLRLLKIVFSN